GEAAGGMPAARLSPLGPVSRFDGLKKRRSQIPRPKVGGWPSVLCVDSTVISISSSEAPWLFILAAWIASCWQTPHPAAWRLVKQVKRVLWCYRWLSLHSQKQ